MTTVTHSENRNLSNFNIKNIIGLLPTATLVVIFCSSFHLLRLLMHSTPISLFHSHLVPLLKWSTSCVYRPGQREWALVGRGSVEFPHSEQSKSHDANI